MSSWDVVGQDRVDDKEEAGEASDVGGVRRGADGIGGAGSALAQTDGGSDIDCAALAHAIAALDRRAAALQVAPPDHHAVAADAVAADDGCAAHCVGAGYGAQAVVAWPVDSV